MRIFLVMLTALFLLSACQTPQKEVMLDTSGLSGKAVNAFKAYSGKWGYADYKAFFYSNTDEMWGESLGFETAEDAIDYARSVCLKRADDCEIYAIGDTVVYKKGSDFLRTAMANYRKEMKAALKPDGSVGDKIVGSDLKADISGKVFKGKSFGGMEFFAFVETDQIIKIRIMGLKPGFVLLDDGNWWVDRDKFCHGMKKFFDGEKGCLSVYRMGEKYFLMNENGELFYTLTLIGDTQKYKNSSKKVFENTQKQNVGYMLGYTEVCSQFRGIGLDNLVALEIKETYKYDSYFQRGYSQFERFTGSDGVIGLKHCEEFRIKLYKLHDLL